MVASPRPPSLPPAGECRQRAFRQPKANGNEVTNHLCLCRRCSNFKQVFERETVCRTKFHMQSVLCRFVFFGGTFAAGDTPTSSHKTSSTVFTSKPNIFSFDSQMMFEWNVCWVSAIAMYVIVYAIEPTVLYVGWWVLDEPASKVSGNKISLFQCFIFLCASWFVVFIYLSSIYLLEI